MAGLSGPPEVELEKVCVMPRVSRQANEFQTPRPAGNSEPQPAHTLLTARDAPRKAVVLGKPGAGKSTLLECLARALAENSSPGGARDFPWAKELPALLPVFYRVRDLDRDLAAHPQWTVWDCLRWRCSNTLGLTLPAGFLVREMERRGLLVLFDGLDEAATPGRRLHVMELVSAVADSGSPSTML